MESPVDVAISILITEMLGRDTVSSLLDAKESYKSLSNTKKMYMLVSSVHHCNVCETTASELVDHPLEGKVIRKICPTNSPSMAAGFRVGTID